MSKMSRYFSSLESTIECQDEEMLQKKLHIDLSSLFYINIFVTTDILSNLSWCYHHQNWIPGTA